MSDLVVVGFEDEYTAFEMRAALARLQNEYLIDTEDVVVVTKNRQGKVKLQQAANLSAAGAVSGGFWGTLIGLLFLNPIMGVVVGAGCGPLARKLSDIGISEGFIKELAEILQPGTSSLFVLVRRATPDKVLEELSGFEGRVITTSLTRDKEEELRDLLSSI